MDISLADTGIAVDLLGGEQIICPSTITLGETILLIDKLNNSTQMKKSDIAINNKKSLEKKMIESGLVINLRNLYAYILKKRLIFTKDELFLDYGELTALFDGAVKAINPGYTDILTVEEMKIERRGDYADILVVVSVDTTNLSKRINVIDISPSELFFYVKIQAYIDFSGKVICQNIEVIPLNADIDSKIIDLLMNVLIRGETCRQHVFIIVESIFNNLGKIGINDKFGIDGIQEEGIKIITY
ncbi:MAG: hypothetical protein EOM87_03120 [Clostridia bacterium]|nr:hypothetical protein [Clostridia bacterium]